MKYLILLLLFSCGKNDIQVTRSVKTPTNTLDIEFRACYDYPDRDCWYKLNTHILHNPDAPAMVSYKDDNVLVEFYYFNDLLHRVGQPAVIRYNADGSIDYELYFENGVRK